MLYPKIQRKSLALLLICLILTLATVGVMFVIYFFYTQENSLIVKPISNKLYSSSNIKINSNGAISDAYHQHHSNHQIQQQQQNKEHFDRTRPNNNAMYSTVNSNTHQRLLTKPKIVKNISNLRNQALSERDNSRNEQQQHHVNDGINRQQFIDDDTTHEIEINDDNYNINNNFYTNSDTIYIDDYDRLLDNVKSSPGNSENPQTLNDQLDINNIDYFETIIMDHKNNHRPKSLLSNRKRGGSARGSNQLSSTIRNTASKQTVASSSSSSLSTDRINNNHNSMSKINSRHWKSSSQMLKTKDLMAESDELLDNETIGSGSGDFIDEEDDDDSGMDNVESIERSNNEKYRTDNHSENFYSVSSEFISNLSNKTTTTISTRNFLTNLSPIFTKSPLSAPQPSNHINNNMDSSMDSSMDSITLPLSNGSNLKKWIPPSIVSSRELLVTTTTTTKSPPSSSISPNSNSNSNLIGNFQSILPPTSTIGQQHDSFLLTFNNNNFQQQPQHSDHQNSGAWLETRARRIMGNVKKSEERSRQLLLCAEAGGGELCRMLFKGHLNE